MRGKKILPIVGYVAFAIAMVLLFLYATFPASAVGQRLAHEIQRGSGGKVSVSFDEVSLYRFTGVSAEGVKVTMRGAGDPVTIALDAVYARVHLLPLLWLSLVVGAEVENGDGSLEATVAYGKDSMEVDVAADEVDFKSPPIISQLAGLPVSGKLSGKLKANLTTSKKAGSTLVMWTKSDAQASLTIAGSGLGPGAVQGFTLPAIDLGQLDLAAEVAEGRFNVTSFRQTGGVVQADLSLSSTVRQLISASTLDACIKFKADSDFLDKNPKLKTALQLAEGLLKKDEEGRLHVPLAGTLSRPRKRSGLCRSTGRK